MTTPITSLQPELRGTSTASSAESDNIVAPSIGVPLEGWIVVGVLVAVIVFGLLKARPSNDSKPTEEATALPPLDLTPKRPNLPPKPHPFEAQTARHLKQKRTVEGSAYVTDGDTIVIKKTQIRLFGIDAPELNHPYGQKAKWAMVKLCKGEKIRAEITEIDAYGRTVARCFLSDGRDLSAELVKQGLAIDWPKFSGGVYRKLGVADVRRKMLLADARQKGRMHVWDKFEAGRKKRSYRFETVRIPTADFAKSYSALGSWTS